MYLLVDVITWKRNQKKVNVAHVVSLFLAEVTT